MPATRDAARRHRMTSLGPKLALGTAQCDHLGVCQSAIKGTRSQLCAPSDPVAETARRTVSPSRFMSQVVEPHRRIEATLDHDQRARCIARNAAGVVPHSRMAATVETASGPDFSDFFRLKRRFDGGSHAYANGHRANPPPTTPTAFEPEGERP